MTTLTITYAWEPEDDIPPEVTRMRDAFMFGYGVTLAIGRDQPQEYGVLEYSYVLGGRSATARLYGPIVPADA